MTISATIPKRHNFAGNDVATSFSYTKKISNQTHIKLVHTDTAGVENALADPLAVDVDYTVNGVGDAGGGTVDFPKAGSVYSTLATGEKLSIIYIFPTEQQLDVPNVGRIFNEDVEDQLDYLTNLISQTEELLDRALKLPEGSTLTDITFPEGASAATRAQKLAVWDATGLLLELLSYSSVATVDPLSIKGDIIQADTGGNAVRLAIGLVGKMLTPVSGSVAYEYIRNLTSTKGSDIASASALVIPDSKDNYWDITGTTPITSISATNLAVGAVIRLHFDGALTLTHHATNLVLPNGANITTIAGDEAVFIQYATDDYRLIGWAGHTLAHTHADAANGGALGNPSFSVNKAGADQTGIVTGTWTKLTWSTEDYDTNTDFASDKFTPTVAGKYHFSGAVVVEDVADVKQLRISLYKNGASVKEGSLSTNGGPFDMAAVLSADLEANGSTDYFELFVFHTHTSDRTVAGEARFTYFNGFKITE